ncbi:MAG: class I SAM-dependent methyltransferase [Thermoanaerobaculia bacterium]
MTRATWNAAWDDRPAEYAAKRDCWLTRRRIRYVAEFLSRARSGDRVLELGSGVGELLIALARERPDLEFTGIEPQQSYVDYAVDSAARADVRNVTFRTAAAEESDRKLPDASRFDWILSNDVLHHVSDTRRVLDAAAALSHGKTRWLAIEPNARNPYSFLSAVVRRGERNFWPREFLEQARASGRAQEDAGFLFLIPPFVRRAPEVLVRLERRLEDIPLLAGGIALTLARV